MDYISVEEAEQMLENLKRQIDIMDHDAEDTLFHLKNVIFKEAQEVRQSLTKGNRNIEQFGNP